MGLDVNGVRFLLYAKSLGVDFSRSAMLGRQSMNLNRKEMIRIIDNFGCSYTDDVVNSLLRGNNRFAEPLLQRLGADTVDSFDNSSYEGATYVHDMNEPIVEKHKQRYSMVLDGGTIEHIFNVPVALKNAMEMLSVGGHFLSIAPANNFVGHGFYQFSPELFFTVFSAANGFDIVDVIALEHKSENWYHVKSPESVRGRVTLKNSVPVYLLVVAEKKESKEVFGSTPQQSDYVQSWNRAGDLKTTKEVKVRGIKRVKARVGKVMRRKFKSLDNGFDPKLYSVFKPETIASLEENFCKAAFTH